MRKRLKTGGRTKGTPNKVTGEIRQILADFVQYNAKDLQEKFEQLDPFAQLTFFEKILKHVLPAKNEITVDDLSESEIDHLLKEFKGEDEEVLVIKGRKFADISKGVDFFTIEE